MLARVIRVLHLLTVLAGGHRALALENLALRRQLAMYRRTRPRPALRWAERLFWVGLRRAWTDWRSALAIVRPGTVVAWHRRGFAWYWIWRSRPIGGRPIVTGELRRLIGEMAGANPLWLAPRIHGDFVTLGLSVSGRTVSRLTPRRRRPPSQTWRTVLQNHASALVALDFFTVPTLTGRVLFVLVVLAHERRRILHVNVTPHPTSAWTRQQLREAWRRECLDHVIVLNERHLRRLLSAYVDHCHRSRTHLALAKDAPEPRAVAAVETGRVVALPAVGGLHHRDERRAA